ncbi:MAG: YdeI family protein [Phototrophicaceae bacterium]
MSAKVDQFLSRAEQWQAEFEQLRVILLDCGLSEAFKWGKPCYTFQDSNIVLMHGFKDYCALLFFKGVLMQDPDDILVAQTENVQATRQIRFPNLQAIVSMEATLKAYIAEAIRVEASGLEVDFKDTEQFDFPDELQAMFDEHPDFAEAWEALTPGRQRGYLLHFSSAKQSKTRISRIEKFMPKIFEGKGWNDR